jgi:hypothetical protein
MTNSPPLASLRRDTAMQQVTPGHDIITSLTAGLIIHRVGQVNYGFLPEAREFARELQTYMNDRLSSDATTFVYEEVAGQCGRLHWFVQMKSPASYRKLLRLVDHDELFRNIYEGDRLPERGGGNWEKMFQQASFFEHVMIPQHGIAGEADLETFVPAARHQLADAPFGALDSGSAGLLVIRTVQAEYAARDLARFYLYEWQTRVNAVTQGAVTATLFEEIWGRQDRLHVLLHMRSPEDHLLLSQLERQDEELRAIMSKPRLTLKGERVGWGGLFEPATMTDTWLLPLHAADSAGRSQA